MAKELAYRLIRHARSAPGHTPLVSLTEGDAMLLEEFIKVFEKTLAQDAEQELTKSDSGKYYEIKAPYKPEGVKKRWIRIGSATKTVGEFGPIVMCTIENPPLNWDGVCALFPSKKKKDE
jgi:hypothetical protein